MEKHLGRKLTSNEVVYHLNGDKSDCGIENLAVMGKSKYGKLCSKLRLTGYTGEDNPNASITDAVAFEIKHSRKLTCILVDRYGVSENVIRGIRSGRKWKHIE